MAFRPFAHRYQAEGDTPIDENRAMRIVSAEHNRRAISARRVFGRDANVAVVAERRRRVWSIHGQNVEQPGVLVARSHGAHLWFAAQSLGPRIPSSLFTMHSLTQTPHRLRNVAGQPCSAIVLYGAGRYSSGTQR